VGIYMILVSGGFSILGALFLGLLRESKRVPGVGDLDLLSWAYFCKCFWCISIAFLTCPGEYFSLFFIGFFF